MNAVIAAFSLYLVQKLAARLVKEGIIPVLVSIGAGSSFAIMRYATENEAYIIPLSFALIATLYFSRYSTDAERSQGILTGVFSSLAVLFHATYIAWWLTILIGFFLVRKYRGIFWFLLPSLSVPVVYILVIFLSEGDVTPDSIRTFFDAGQSNNALFGLSLKGVMFAFISLLRSFFQAHGYIFNMLKENLLNLIPLFLTGLLLTISFFRLMKSKLTRWNSPFAVFLIILLGMNFCVAFISYGNAEFMVMIPLITFLLISLVIEKPANVLLLIAAAQLIWNLTFGLIPLSRAGGEHEKFMIEKLKEPGKVLLIARDDQLMKSINYYYSGKKDEIRILRSPAVTKLKGIDLTKYKASIDSSLSAGVTIYTDCIGRIPVSRATISEGKINEAFFSEYKLLRIYSDTLAAGGKSVYRIIAE